MNVNDYLEVFSWLKSGTYNNVQGVRILVGAQKGPNLGITIMTHGNEPSGLAAASFVKNYFKQNSLKKGRIILAINNIKAGEKYLNASSYEDRCACRFLEVNMNRLPEDLPKDDNRYEVQRARELLPIWQQFDVGIDIHSTLLESDPMIIQRQKSDSLYTSRFPIKNVLTNIYDVQIGLPAAGFYGNSNSYAFSIESGQHESSEGPERVISCIKSLLNDLDMASFPQTTPIKQEVYKVVSSIVIPEYGYNFIKTIPCFTEVKKGTVIATNNKSQKISLDDNYISLFAPPAGPIPYTTEEAMFLAKKVT